MKEEFQENIQINIADSVGVTGGISAPDSVDSRSGQSIEDVVNLLKNYVKPHKYISRDVTVDDIPRVVSDAQTMVKMCHIVRGIYGNAWAIAHPQINDEDPLRFFATRDGIVVINPVVISHTKAHVEKKEGCLSYPEEPMKIVDRFNWITVQYQSLIHGDDGKPVLSEVQERNFNGNIANVFQHEIGHLNGCYIYDEDYTPEKAVTNPNK